MLTFQDCLAFCELNEGEIKAIALHEHIPQIVAAEMGCYLLHTPDGVPAIRRMILDDIHRARNAGDHAKRQKLLLVLKHFVESHPQRKSSKPRRAS
ncbi:MAG: hypothetical protein AB7G15_11825 [Alphaproteobacteria bacterium]